MSPPADASLQADFASGLLRRGAAPGGLTGPGGGPAAKRYSVYRNNVAVSLIEALQAAYTAVTRLLGEDYFRALAGEFVRAHPPRSPVLLDYGAGFGDFIDAFPPLADYPWLGDVARLERAWLDAYHAADASPLALQALAAIAPEALSAARFTPHPATRIVRSSHPHVGIFEANRHDGPVPAPGAPGEDALVTRPALDVQVRRLPAGGAAFLCALIAGANLGDAAEAGAAASSEFVLSRNISGMLEAGVFAAVEGAG